MKNNIKLAKTVLLILFSSSCLSEKNTINACFTEWYPYSYTQKNQAVGLSINIYNAIFKRTDMQVKYTEQPWSRCKKEFSEGKFDAIVDGGINIPNSLNAKKRPVLWVVLFWVNKESPHNTFIEYSQFDNQSIGYVRGYGYPKGFTDYKNFKEKYALRKDDLALKMLHRGRLDAFIGDIVNSSFIVNKHQLQVRAIAPAIQIQSLTMSFSNSLKEQHEKFESSLNEMYEDGSIDRIYKKTLGLTYKEFIEKYKAK